MTRLLVDGLRLDYQATPCLASIPVSQIDRPFVRGRQRRRGKKTAESRHLSAKKTKADEYFSRHCAC
jgi:hypothetical protein